MKLYAEVSCGKGGGGGSGCEVMGIPYWYWQGGGINSCCW